ncbi:DUF3993 domain-containing protein [Neobacillus sp. SM06]|uniref:DUF3993 domain-containing protein n=1 Tax=Neobacillus sp. SM06 TaxID=3422492 RepID=UPI003D27B10A
MKKLLILVILLLITVVPLSPEATSEMTTRSDVFTFLKDAYKAQVSLSEKGRTKQEINAIIGPYFSDNYQQLFWKANIVQEKGKFLTYGSDFAPYYIPYYQFSRKTKVVFLPNQIYVFEYFPEKLDGPVGYKSHYEGLLIKKGAGGEGWKVDSYLFDQIPKEIIAKGNNQTE